MKLVLEKMYIDNFRGSRDRTIEFGAITNVYGMPGTGKTTIPDAYFWVLLNTDSQGNAPGSDKFPEKPLDADGNIIHNLDTTVELTMRIDGAPFVLKRLQKENWVKKSGSPNPLFQGNTSLYWINGVEKKVAEFRAEIFAICPEKAFTSVAMMSNFNNADWKKQRETLLALPDVNIDEELFSRPEYAEIAHECRDKNISVNDYKSILFKRIPLLNKELELIQPRVNEASRNIPVFKEGEITLARDSVKMLTARISELDTQIAAENYAAATNDKDKRLRLLRQSLAELKASLETEATQKAATVTRAYNVIRDSVNDAKNAIENGNGNIRRNAEALENATIARDRSRAEYAKVSKEQYVAPKIGTACPTCGQPLPKENLEKAFAKAQAEFEAYKSSRLKSIIDTGTSQKEQIAAAQRNLDHYGAIVAAAVTDLDKYEPQLKQLSEQLEAARKGPVYTDNDAYNSLVSEIASETARLQANTSTNGNRGEELRAGREAARQELANAEAVLRKEEAGNAARDRVQELLARQRDIGNTLSEIEQTLANIESFVVARCEVLERAIDQLFPTIRWKLFNKQINGGIAETCVCMVPNTDKTALIPYTGTNTGARYAADIEIINALSDHFNVSMPVFFDNREHVTSVNDTRGQLITLAVTNDPVIRIEKIGGLDNVNE